MLKTDEAGELTLYVCVCSGYLHFGECAAMVLSQSAAEHHTHIPVSYRRNKRGPVSERRDSAIGWGGHDKYILR